MTNIKNIAKVFDLPDRQVLFYKDERDEEVNEDVSDQEFPWLVTARYHMADGALAEAKYGFATEDTRDRAFDGMDLEAAQAAVNRTKDIEDMLCADDEDDEDCDDEDDSDYFDEDE
tara:strand:- start:728 stop:1075 length:348 start_codon:yes stop_codon:yes gene_type:complete